MSEIMPGHIDVLLFQRTAINFYPPTINQANLLAESGLKVALMDGGESDGPAPSLSPDISLIRPLTENQNAISGNLKLLSTFRAMLKACDRGVCIAYDPPAATLLGLLPFSGYKVFHFHEYPSGDGVGSEGIKFVLLNRIASHFARKVESVVMADSHRASAFYKENKLPTRPVVVPNCPRSISKLPDGLLRNKLASSGMGKKYVLLFQGAVSTNYYADHIVKSMQFWPEESVVVFIGPFQPGIKEKLEKIASGIGVSKRLVFLGQIPYAELSSYTVDADIAFTMIKPVTFNFMHMAGASNKRYEAMACGVPQISNKGPGMEELIEDNGVGVCVDAENPEEIGRAVTELLSDENRRKELSDRARTLHLEKYNYEYQFYPQLKRIVKWCRGDS